MPHVLRGSSCNIDRYDVILHDITKNRFDIMCDNRVVLDSSEADLRELNSEVTLKAMRRELQAALPHLTSETFQVQLCSRGSNAVLTSLVGTLWRC